MESPRRTPRRRFRRANTTSSWPADRSSGLPGSRERPSRAGLRQVEEHRLELYADEIHVPNPQTLEFLGDEFSIAVEGIQDEEFLIAREDVGVGQPGLRERSRRKVKLDANVATKEAANFREILPVRFAEHDTGAPSRSSERVEQEPKDFRSDGKRTHAEDLAVAREDHLSQLATNRLGPFVDPQVRIRVPTLRRRCFLQFRDDLGGRLLPGQP